MSCYQDLFLDGCEAYAKFRRGCPVAILDSIPEFGDHDSKVTVDAATGNGQAARVLAGMFDRVIGIDVSSSQIAQAPQISNVSYHISRSENFLDVCSLPRNSVDLITASQAVHWLDVHAFYRECRSALKPNGTFAAWCYPAWSCSNNSEANEVLNDFWWNVMNPYWTEPILKYCKDGYKDLIHSRDHFAVAERVVIIMKEKMNMIQLKGDISTRLVYAEYRKKNFDDPAIPFSEKMHKALDLESDTQEFDIDWPVALVLAKQPLPLADP